MARVLVTGASGFIGRHVVRNLAQHNHDIACLVRPMSRTEWIGRYASELVPGDVTDAASLASAVQRRDVVLHLAGVTKSFSPRSMRRVNEVGAGNVAAACARESTPPVLVLVSSLAAAGPSTGDRPRIETDVPEPVSWYGQSKLAGEQAAIRYADRIPLTILRPPIVFGEGDTNALALFKSIARFGVHAVPGTGDDRYSMVHAADLADALRLVAERGERVCHGRSGGTYFVAGHETPTFNELGQMIAEVLGKPHIRIIHNPGPVVWMVGAVCELVSRISRQPFIMNLDKAREATGGSWDCDGSALFRLGFDPAPLRDRLRQTAAWYQQQGWLPQKQPRRAGVFWRTSREQ